MKKTMKTLGVVATSAALALGCAVPAFATAAPDAAAPESFANTQEQEYLGASGKGMDGTSAINVFGYDSDKQIVATIPISVTLAAPAEGGALIPPTSGTYAISNTGALNIKVTQIKAQPTDNWDIVSALTSTNTAKAQIVLNAENGGAKIALSTSAQDAFATGSTAWTAAKKASDGTVNKIAVELSGEAHGKNLGGANFEALTTGASNATKAVDIVYTIASATDAEV